MRHDSPSRATATLGWALAGFFGLQAGLAIAIQTCLPGLADPRYAYRLERLRRHFGRRAATVRERGDRLLTVAAHRATRVLALGGSRTLFGMDAIGLGTELTAATGQPVALFNFGIVGAGPITELFYLRKLLRDGVAPDVLLVEVLPAFLTGQRSPPPEARWFLTDTRLRPSDRALLARYRFPVNGLRQTARYTWAVPWYAHRRALLSRLVPCWLPRRIRLDEWRLTDAAGWVSERPALPDRRQLEEVDREHFASCFKDFRLGGAPADALRELLADCRQAHIAPIVLLLPETTRFRSWYPAGMEEQLQDFLRGLAVPWIDARGWVADDGFFDTNHLHPGGAAVLRSKLAEVLPGLLEGRGNASPQRR